jgi:hypothetical protein
MRSRFDIVSKLTISLVGLVLSCSASTSGGGSPGAGDAQTPPVTSAADVDAWLAKGSFLSWKCETMPHDFGKPSPHGVAIVCANDLVSGHGTGEYAVGAASVVVLYDTAGANVVGHAVDLHIAAGAADTDWFWFNHDATGVTVFGPGGASTPQETACIGCHASAGIGYTGHDYVFVQIN